MSLIDSLSRQRPQNADFLAVLNDEASVRMVEQFVAETVIPHALVRRGTIADTVALLASMDRPPRQLMVDVSTSAMPLSDLISLADACPPGVSVLVVGERNDIGLFRDLLRMGIDDYVVKPLTVDLLHRVLDHNGHPAEPVQQTRTGKVVLCMGSRGGVGTSTVAANIAWRLANDQERRIAIIDLDPFGGPLAVLLGAKPATGLQDLLKNINRLDPNYVERSFVPVGRRLFLLGAGHDLDDEDGEIPVEPLSQLLGILKKHFHYVILDLAGRGGVLATAMVGLAESIVLVTEPSVFAARETVRLTGLVDRRETKAPLLLVVNNPHAAGRSELGVPDFEDAIGRRPSHVLPFDRDTAGRAENLGPPAVAGRGPLAIGLRALADDLAGRRTETSAPHPLLARLPARIQSLFHRP